VLPRIRQLTAGLRDDWRTLHAKIELIIGEFIDLVRCDDAARRLTSIPGMGVLSASALVAAFCNVGGFLIRRRILVLGWGPFLHGIRPGASPGCSASLSGATLTCGPCSSIVREPHWRRSRKPTRLGEGG
jgi:hypothetical protein